MLFGACLFLFSGFVVDCLLRCVGSLSFGYCLLSMLVVGCCLFIVGCVLFVVRCFCLLFVVVVVRRCVSL